MAEAELTVVNTKKTQHRSTALTFMTARHFAPTLGISTVLKRSPWSVIVRRFRNGSFSEPAWKVPPYTKMYVASKVRSTKITGNKKNKPTAHTRKKNQNSP